MFYIAKYLVARIRKEEDGVALSEYLILLGLLVGGVIAAVILFGNNLELAWNNWAGWIVSLDDAIPAAAP